jgi:hypothetical protein
MRAWGVIACLACAGAALFAAPAASAKPGYFVEKPSVHLEASTHATNGYWVSVANRGGGGVQLTVNKGEGEAVYSVRGNVSSSGLKAHFGPFGRVDLKFHGVPTQKQPKGHVRCRGENPIREVGHFTGVLRFRGEQGYTSAAVNRVRGSLKRTFRQVCKSLGPPPKSAPSLADMPPNPNPPEFTGLAAFSGAEGRTTSLFYFKVSAHLGGPYEDLSLAFVGAASNETVGRVHVHRKAFVAVGEKAVQVSPLGTEPVTATLHFPPPFTGTASYGQVGDEEPVWSGTLAIALPGPENVALTGEGFTAILCRGNDAEKAQRCLTKMTPETKGARPTRSRPYGSGSHSQAFWDARLSWSR